MNLKEVTGEGLIIREANGSFTVMVKGVGYVADLPGVSCLNPSSTKASTSFR